MADPVLVQYVRSANTGPTSSTAVPTNEVYAYLPNPTLGGNCIVLALFWGDATTTVTVTDDQGNTYNVGVAHIDTPNAAQATLYYVMNCTAGTRRLKFAFSALTNFIDFELSEWYNVAQVSASAGSAHAAGSSTTPAAGSFTPSVSGCLIYNAVWNDRSVPAWMTAEYAKASGFSLLTADRVNGRASQYQVQAVAAAVNPSFTTGNEILGTPSWISLALALKGAVAGTPPGRGIRIVGVHWQDVGMADTDPNFQEVQFPCQGNLVVGMYLGYRLLPAVNHSSEIAAVRDSLGNIYSVTSPSLNPRDGGNAQAFYAVDARTGESNVVRVWFNEQAHQASSIVFYDIAGAADDAYDGVAMGAGLEPVAGNLAVVTMTPRTPYGLILCVVGVSFGTMRELIGALYQTDNPWTLQEDGQESRFHEDNGWGHAYNVDLSALTFNWTRSAAAPEAWSALAIAFRSELTPNIGAVLAIQQRI